VYYDGTRAKGFCDLGHLLICPVILPVGVHLRTVKVICERSGATEQYIRLRRLTYALPPVSTNIEIITNLAGGVVEVTFATVDIEVDGTEMFVIDALGLGAAGVGHNVYGASVEYDSPALAATY